MNEILFYDRPDLVERIQKEISAVVINKDAVMHYCTAECRSVQLPPRSCIDGRVSKVESQEDAEDKLISVIVQRAIDGQRLALWSYWIRDYEDHTRISVRGVWHHVARINK